MGWQIEVSAAAQKTLRKIGSVEADRITRMLQEIGKLDDPRTRGHILTGELSGMWRYRAGDWRIICRIEDRRLIILIVSIGHRSEIYR